MDKLKKVVVLLILLTIMAGYSISYATTDNFMYKGTATPSVSAKASSSSSISGSEIPEWIFVVTGIAIIACVFLYIRVILRKKKMEREKNKNDENVDIREEE